MPSRKRLLQSIVSSHLLQPSALGDSDSFCMSAALHASYAGSVPALGLGLSAAEVDALTLSTLSSDAQPALTFASLASSPSSCSPVKPQPALFPPFFTPRTTSALASNADAAQMSFSASSSPVPPSGGAALGGKQCSLKHRILSRPGHSSVVVGMSPDASVSGGSTPMVSPSPSHSSSHSDPDRAPPPPALATTSEPQPERSELRLPNKKRARVLRRQNDEVAGTSTPSPSSSLQLPVADCHMSGSSSELSTPCISPKSVASPSPNKFCQGSLIQLANGQLKAVESMTVEDFEVSAAMSANLRVEYSVVSRIEKSLSYLRMERSDDTGVVIYFRVGHRSAEVAVEATIAHPFFVLNKGWSSVSPTSTQSRFGLKVALLVAGDTCISLACRESLHSSQGPNERFPLASGPSSSLVKASEPSSMSRPEAVLITKLDSRTTFPFHCVPPGQIGLGPGPSPPVGMGMDSAGLMVAGTGGSHPLVFAGTESELASFRRWSAPEDDRLLETFLAHSSK